MHQYRQRKTPPPAPSPNNSYWQRILMLLENIFSFLLKIINQIKSLAKKKSPPVLIVSLFGIGYLPVFPGTWASLATLAVCAILVPILPVSLFIINIFFIFFLGTTLLVILFYKSPDMSSDPSYVVVDEVVGQMIALLPVLHNISYWPIALLSFRFFDIKKPLLVSWPELNLHGTPISSALSIMLDDVLAGVYAAGLTYISFMVIESIF